MLSETATIATYAENHPLVLNVSVGNLCFDTGDLYTASTSFIQNTSKLLLWEAFQLVGLPTFTYGILAIYCLKTLTGSLLQGQTKKEAAYVYMQLNFK